MKYTTKIHHDYMTFAPIVKSSTNRVSLSFVLTYSHFHMLLVEAKDGRKNLYMFYSKSQMLYNMRLMMEMGREISDIYLAPQDIPFWDGYPMEVNHVPPQEK